MSYKKRACRSGIYSANQKRSYGFLPLGADLIRDKTSDAAYCFLPNQLSFSCS